MANSSTRSPDSSPAPASDFHPAIFCQADRTGRLDSRWLAMLREHFPDATLYARPRAAEQAGLQALDCQPDNPESIRAAFDPPALEHGLLILRSGLRLPAFFRQRLRLLVAGSESPALTVFPGNYDGSVNPLAGVEADLDPDGLDSLIAACADRRSTPWSLGPVQCAFIRSSAATGRSPLKPALVDDFFVVDPTRSVACGGRQTPASRAALGHLRHRVLALHREGIKRLPLIGLDGQPVTLHIGHSWGGGLGQWIGDFCQHDRHGHHLVLASRGNPDSREHGQSLRLYAAGPGQALVQEFILTPPIADTVPEHAQYREIFGWLLARYGVGRVLVSSLIGHALDCMRTSLPTAQILHDFYPASPLLHVDPLPYLGNDGRFHMQRALDEHGAEMIFSSRSADHWRRVRDGWFEAVQKFGIRLIAPSGHVAQRWSRLFRDRLEKIEVIGHGFSPPWPAGQRLARRSRADGKLTLVVVGRQSVGKGLALLQAALPRLREHVRIVLVGAGKEAEALFGVAGVDIILDYRRDQLPELLTGIGPHAALFLSTVPETWNYVLSEIRSLGLVPLATRVGSFPERIVEGEDGLLFDPHADALVEVVAGVAEHPERLIEMASKPAEEPSVASVVDHYNLIVLPAAPAPKTLIGTGYGLPQLSAVLADNTDQQRTLQGNQARLAEMDAELGRRATWAKRQGRLAEERTRWAWSLERELTATREQLNQTIQSQAQELGRLTALNEALEQQLNTIVHSASWRYTRPVRFLMRAGRKLRARRLWNPLRWPAFVRLSWSNLRHHGVRGTLTLIHTQPVSAAHSPGIPPVLPDSYRGTGEPVALAETRQPAVSIVIPVFNKIELTAACLASIRAARNRVGFEVIVVDDCSADETESWLARCSGLTVLRNESNSGFIDSCNRGAARARGEFLVFLNNDTTVTDGWLDALLEPFQADPEGTGIVGARLVYPDGRLQEAGGIIFSDGSGWNYGRDQRADLPQYSFLSEADYVSGACLTIRRADFESFGGFDIRFRPAYYEDTDLCFQVRARGQKVLVQPAATIIHHEGATSGTDLASGTKKYQAINREKFRDKWAAMLADHPPPRPDPDRIDPVRHLRYRRFRQRALVLDAVTPQPDHDSGSVRILAMMTLLRDMGHLVSFMPQNLQWVDAYSAAVQQAGIELLWGPQVGSLEHWLGEYGRDLDLVLVSRHYVLAPTIQLIRRLCPRARLIFDTVDLHFLREQREAELTGSPELARQAEQTRVQELKLVRSADVTLVVSPVEQQLLHDLEPAADVRVVSNIHEVHGCRVDWQERRGLLFVGGFQHVPNVDAAHWLVEEIFPRVRGEIPDIELHLIGSRMPSEIRSINSPGVRVHGFVQDLEPYLSGCRVSVAPLRYGAGVKGKVNQSMSYGLPVVATACAAEGMYLEHGQDVLVAETADDFAREVVRLNQERGLWEKLSAGGLANVERHFSRAAARRNLECLLDPVR